jgi:ubiquinone biosynthesis monooxygenase Coq7
VTPKSDSDTRHGPRWIPGDPRGKSLVDGIVRVDHAGEYGATRIYAGQIAVLGDRHRAAPELRHMLAQEQEHLKTFEKMIVARRVRPTALTPLWHVAGFALGAVTAAMGEKAAMACTVAIEEAIDEHYAAQAQALENLPEEAELKSVVEKFREEELEHRDTALANGAEQALGYPVLSAAIKAGSRLAIWLSQRV